MFNRLALNQLVQPCQQRSRQRVWQAGRVASPGARFALPEGVSVAYFASQPRGPQLDLRRVGAKEAI